MSGGGRAPVVETRFGRVRGARVGQVSVFKGLRYGATTAGANRFRPPRRPEPWAGVMDAVTWPLSAPQSERIAGRGPFYAWYSAIQPISEDCLFLSVFTPGLDDTRRPVMVWLHGGGWTNFSGSAPGTDGTTLARSQDVVVVTVNHRLNVFGYVKLDGEDERFAGSGNAGLLDLVQALHWVADNIAAFGGDPGNVTIFGQSGGASKVAALLAMPVARGLFERAIVQSMSGGLHLTGAEEAARQSAGLANALGLASLEGEVLQRVPMATLLAAMAKVATPFRPIIDGRNFARDPWHPEAPSAAIGVPLLVGTAATETTYYLRPDARNFSLERMDVEKRLGRFLGIESVSAAAIYRRYQAALPTATPSGILVAVTTDHLFRRNTLCLGALQAAGGCSQVYAYVFARATPVEGGRLGAPHTSEIPFIFGTTAAASAIVGHGEDVPAMSERMMAAWASFARTGAPDTPLLPLWRPYNHADRPTMILDVESRLEQDPGGHNRAALDGLAHYQYSTSRREFAGDGG